MNQIRKVPASAGAEWLLGGFALLRRSPFGLGLLGAIFGMLAGAVAMLGMASPMLMLPLQLVMALAGPLLIAGMVWAAREVDLGRPAQPGQLLRAVQDGKTARLLATLLPQVAAGVLCVALLFVVIGPAQLQQLVAAVEQSQGQARVDPGLIQGFPMGRFLLWLLLALAVGVVAGFFTFIAIPEMMFTASGALEAMKRSFRACIRNLPALVVFFVLLIIAAIAISIAVQIVAVVVKLAIGEQAMVFASQVLLMAVLMPVVTGAMYRAWRQLVADDGASAPAVPDNAGIEA